MKLNIKRMRRNMARSRPDRVVYYWDLFDNTDIARAKQKRFVERFQEDMRIKHCNKGGVDIYVDDDLSRHLSEQPYVLVYRPQ